MGSCPATLKARRLSEAAALAGKSLPGSDCPVGFQMETLFSSLNIIYTLLLQVFETRGRLNTNRVHLHGKLFIFIHHLGGLGQFPGGSTSSSLWLSWSFSERQSATTQTASVQPAMSLNERRNTPLMFLSNLDFFIQSWWDWNQHFIFSCLIRVTEDVGWQTASCF